jgi:hypothetical protein
MCSFVTMTTMMTTMKKVRGYLRVSLVAVIVVAMMMMMMMMTVQVHLIVCLKLWQLWGR